MEPATTPDYERSTVLDDDGGEKHEYSIFLYPASHGFDLMLRIGYSFVPLLALIFDDKTSGDLDKVVGGDLDTLDVEPTSASEAASKLIERLQQLGGAQFIREQVFHGVTRDGQRLGGPMVKSDAFNKAFRGNYGELFAAALWVLGENFGGTVARSPFDQTSVLSRLKASSGQPTNAHTASTSAPALG